MEIKLRYKLIAMSVALGGVFLLGRCGRIVSTVPNPPAVLPANEDARITVQRHVVTTQDKRGLHSTYVPPNTTAVIDVQKNGVTQVRVASMGWGGDFGGGIAYGNEPRLTLDKGVAYWNRLSLNVGVGIGRVPVVEGFVAGGYRLDRFKYTQNTSVLAGKVLNSKFLSTADGWQVGLRWSF